MKPNFHAIIFDMDGTMIDNMLIHNQIWVDFFREHGLDLDIDDFNRRTAGRTTPEILRMHLGEELSAETIEAMGEEKESRYRDYFATHARPVDGLRDLLQAARQAGLRLGVATAAPPKNVDFVMDCLGLAGAFDAVVNGAEIRNGKPDPELFLTAAARMNVAPQDCLVFEDSQMGLEAARRAGMPAVVVTTSIPAEQGRQIPGVILAVGNFTEALGLIEN